jgi:hypothetical protein
MKIFVAFSVLAACLIVPAAPALADVEPLREEDTSAFNSQAGKFARAECPGNQVVIGIGGRINGGNGGVAMTGIVPDASLSAVTVFGRELPGHDQPWSVTAVAICHTVLDRGLVERISSLVPGQYLAQAECPNNKMLYSVGFHMPQPDGDEFLRAAVPSPDLRVVTVQADGPGVDPGSLIAYGICAPPMVDEAVTRADPTAFDSSSPKEAFAGPPEDLNLNLGSWMFGAGAAVKGARGILIDALTPMPGLDRAFKAAFPGVAARVLLDGEDDWELEVSGDYVGEWY